MGLYATVCERINARRTNLKPQEEIVDSSEGAQRQIRSGGIDQSLVEETKVMCFEEETVFSWRGTWSVIQIRRGFWAWSP